MPFSSTASITTPALLIEESGGPLTQDTTGFNILFVHSSIDEMGLSAAAFRVYAHLARRSNKAHHAWPGIREIADTCRLSKTTVMAAIKEIEQRGMVVVTRSKTKSGTNDYFLPDAAEWIKEHEAGCVNLSNKKCTKLGNTPRRARTGAAKAVSVQKKVAHEKTDEPVPIKGTSSTNLGYAPVPIKVTEVYPVKDIHEGNPIAGDSFGFVVEMDRGKKQRRQKSVVDNPPSLSEFISHGLSKGGIRHMIETQFDIWSDDKWVDGNGNDIFRWKGKLNLFIKNKYGAFKPGENYSRKENTHNRIIHLRDV